MGCVLTCFRTKDDENRNDHLLLRLIPFNRKRCLASKENAPIALESETKEIESFISADRSGGELLDEHDEISMSQTLLHDDSGFRESTSAAYSMGVVQASGRSDNTLIIPSESNIDGGNHECQLESELETIGLNASQYPTHRQIQAIESSHSPEFLRNDNLGVVQASGSSDTSVIPSESNIDGLGVGQASESSYNTSIIPSESNIDNGNHESQLESELETIGLNVSQYPTHRQIQAIESIHSPEFLRNDNLGDVQASGSLDTSVIPSESNIDGGNHDSILKLNLETIELDVSPDPTDRQINAFEPSESPFKTPLNITDEMQTPFTVYRSDLENSTIKKNARVRTEYVYPVLKPVENLDQWRAPRVNSSQPQQSGSLSANLGKLQQLSPTSLHKGLRCLSSPNGKREGSERMAPPTHNKRTKIFSSENRELTDSSLSKWRTPPPTDDERKWNCVVAEKIRNGHSRKSLDEDDSSFGFIPAQSNDAGPCLSPKLWDGNGIPNTTSKYKEDQKVTWHTTPFEERLQKVLSNDNLLPQRKLVEG